MFARGVPLWCWWILVVFFLSAPWFGFTKQPQTERVHIAPFTDPADKPRDLALNVLLFVPFGFSYARWRRTRFGALEAIAIAAAVSATAEATQLFSAVRYPSATDVTAAAVGAVAGALLARVWDEKRDELT